MRYDTDDAILDNSQFYRASNNNQETVTSEEEQKIWLSLVNANNQSSSTLIGYVEGATLGKDRSYDAVANRLSSALSIHTIIENTSSHMVIQGRPLPFNEEDVVDLGITIPTTGVYTIAIDHLQGDVLTGEETYVILEDTYTGMMYNLKEEPFSVNLDAGSYNDRFKLKYRGNALGVDEVKSTDTFVYIKNGSLHAQSSKTIERIQVYDLSGKLVMDYRPETTSLNISTGFNYARGAYIAIVSLEENISFSKKLLN